MTSAFVIWQCTISRTHSRESHADSSFVYDLSYTQGRRHPPFIMDEIDK